MGPRDSDRYPDGRFNVGGVGRFRLMLGESSSAVDCHAGAIPECFFDGADFALAVLDVDNYEPTRIALRWLDARSHVLAVDDFIKGADAHAAGAIAEWAQSTEREMIDLGDDQAAFVRGG